MTDEKIQPCGVIPTLEAISSKEDSELEDSFRVTEVTVSADD